VISVFMVHSQKMLIFKIKLPPALRTDQPVDFKGLLPIITNLRSTLFQLLHNVSYRSGIAVICCLLFIDSERPSLSHRNSVYIV